MQKLFALRDIELKIKASSLRKTGFVISGSALAVFIFILLAANVLQGYGELLEVAASIIIMACLVAAGWWFVAGLYLYLAAFVASMFSTAKTRWHKIAIYCFAGFFVLTLPILGVMLSIMMMGLGSPQGFID